MTMDTSENASIEPLETIQDREFTTEIGTYQTKHSGLAMRIFDAWKDMRASTRRIINENPSEGRLLFYILLSDMIFFLSWALKAVVAPTLSAKDMLPAEIGIWLVVALFARTASVYAFSLVLGFAMRIFGGKGSWKSTRAGVFWGSLVAAPFGLFFAIVTVLFASFETQFPFLQDTFISHAPYWMSLVPFVYFISAGIAEAHHFKQTYPVFAGMTFVAMVMWFLALYMRVNGII